MRIIMQIKIRQRSIQLSLLFKDQPGNLFKSYNALPVGSNRNKLTNLGYWKSFGRQNIIVTNRKQINLTRFL